MKTENILNHARTHPCIPPRPLTHLSPILAVQRSGWVFNHNNRRSFLITFEQVTHMWKDLLGWRCWESWLFRSLGWDGCWLDQTSWLIYKTGFLGRYQRRRWFGRLKVHQWLRLKEWLFIYSDTTKWMALNLAQNTEPGNKLTEMWTYTLFSLYFVPPGTHPYWNVEIKPFCFHCVFYIAFWKHHSTRPQYVSQESSTLMQAVRLALGRSYGNIKYLDGWK